MVRSEEIVLDRRNCGGESEILIRPARPDDAPSAGELIYLPMGKLADYLFGSDDPRRAKEVLSALFRQRQTRFSYQFSDVLEANQEMVGLLLGCPGTALKEMESSMVRQLRALFGLHEMWRFLRRSLLLMRCKESESGEFYIMTLAVAPRFQNRGFGSLLLANADAKARKLGMTKCSLGVDVDNFGAIRFYSKNGFRVTETLRVPPLEQAIGYPGYHRMVKSLVSPVRPLTEIFRKHHAETDGR